MSVAYASPQCGNAHRIGLFFALHPRQLGFIFDTRERIIVKTNRRTFVAGASALAVFSGVKTASAEKKYSDGASDTEIKIGHTGPYSGPASSYGVIGKSIEAYWKMVNDQGGINGRKVTFITYDDGYSPPKTVEMTRKLVEQDKVLCIFNPLGTPTSTAVHKYMNQKKVPHLFIGAGATKWGDPKHFPWTIGWQPDYQTEAAIYAKHALTEHKGEKICLLWQNDDAGKDYAEGFMKGLGKENEKLVVASVSYEPTDATVDSQVIQLKNSGATVLFSHVIPKQAAQAIRKAAELGWQRTHYLANVSASVGAVMKPAGFENCQGVISSTYLKDPTDSQWAKAPDFVRGANGWTSTSPPPTRPTSSTSMPTPSRRRCTKC